MQKNFDIVIAGGAIIGSSLAYFLSAHPGFTGSVAVIEKDLTFERSSTVRSASSIRQQFTTPINIDISTHISQMRMGKSGNFGSIV